MVLLSLLFFSFTVGVCISLVRTGLLWPGKQVGRVIVRIRGGLAHGSCQGPCYSCKRLKRNDLHKLVRGQNSARIVSKLSGRTKVRRRRDPPNWGVFATMSSRIAPQGPHEPQ